MRYQYRVGVIVPFAQKYYKQLILAVAAIFMSSMAAMSLSANAASTSTVVSPSNMNGWAHFPENTPGGSGTFETGPGTPPYGSGSFEMTLTASNQSYVIATTAFAGTALADLEDLNYSTYRTSSADPAQAIALQFEFDNDLTDGNDLFKGRMVYEPYHNGQVVQTGIWQEWETLNDATGNGTGNWWGSPIINSPLDEACPQSNPCTFAEILTAFPNAGIRNPITPTTGGLYFKAGSGWANFVGNVDGLEIVMENDDSVTVDFEFETTSGTPIGVLGSKDDCKKDGWKTSTIPTFKNQGQCVSYFQTEFKRTSATELDSADIDGININTIDGVWYKVTVAGTWANRSGELVDAECTSWQGGDWMNAVDGGYNPSLLDVQVNEEFVDWGACDDANSYTRWIEGDGNDVNLRIFDGDVDTNTQNPGWFGDNVGTLDVMVVSFN